MMKRLCIFLLSILLCGMGIFSTPHTKGASASAPSVREETIHFADCSGDYLFVRNPGETSRMVNALRDVAGESADSLQIQTAIPEDVFCTAFSHWKPEQVTSLYDPTSPKVYYLEAWDIYKNGEFQKVCYQAASELSLS